MRDDEPLVGEKRHLRAAGVVRAAGYDAFISYSHALDGKLAPVFQRELERFAKPWYRMRSVRVFRDEASLTANPGLWSSITDALSRSEWFILMASPESARSVWVNKEAAWWLEHAEDPVRHMLIVLTAGDLVWDEQETGFPVSGPSVLPPVLRGVFTEEPRWVDLRWLRNAEQLDSSNPRLRDCAADVAAALQGTDKDLIVGEHIRQHRRALRLARAGITALAAFLVIALAATVIAVAQRDTAVKNLRVANARQLAALAVANLNDHIDLAQLFAVAAYQMDPDPQTRSALFQAVTASPHLARYLPVGSPVSVLAGSADGSIVAAGTDDGRLLRWDTGRGTLTESRTGGEKVTAIAVDADGGRIVAADGAKAYLWNATSATKPRVIYTGLFNSVAISPTGRTLAVLGGKSASELMNPPPLPVMVLDGNTGTKLRRTLVNAVYSYISLPDDAMLQLDSSSMWTRLSASTLSVISAGQVNATPGDLYYCCGYSPNGRYFAWAKYGWADVVDNNAAASLDQGGANPYHLTTEPVLAPDQFAVTDDGTEMALAGGGALYVAHAAGAPSRVSKVMSFDPVQELPGTGRISALTFLGGSQRLVSANGSALAVWDGSQVSRITTGQIIDAPDCDNVGVPPKVAISPDSTRIATGGEGSRPAVLENLRTQPSSLSIDQPIENALPLWASDSSQLFLLGDAGAGRGALVWSDGSFRSTWPGSSARNNDVNGTQAPGEAVAARLSADGREVILVNQDGDIQIRESGDGVILRKIPGISREIIPVSGGELQNRAAISMDAATVAFVLPDGAVRVTSVPSGEHHDLPGPPARVISYTADQLLIERLDGTLDEWDTLGTRLIRSIPGDAAYAEGITGIPHSSLVARLTYQGTVELTDLDSGQTLGSVTTPLPARSGGEPPWDSTTISATPDGSELVTASSCGSIIRWQLDPRAWIRDACTLAGHDLTAEEWRQYVGTNPPANLACLG